jgi:hypothetical protein
LPGNVDSIEQALFKASVSVTVGSGESTWFWREKWLNGQCMSSLAPDLLLAVDKRDVKVRTVAQALQNNRWVADITGSLSALAIPQYLALWERSEGFHHDVSVPDRFCWKWTASGQYSASSAYRAFFLGQSGILGARELRKTRAPPPCKFFVWLALLGRCWTSERLQCQSAK